MDTHSVYMFLKSLEAHGVTCDVNIECVGDEQIPGLHVTYQNKFKFFPTPLSALPWMQERYREDLTELLGDLALPLVEKDENMSETPEQYGKPVRQQTLSADVRLEHLKDIHRTLLGIEVMAKNAGMLGIVKALEQARPALKALFEDASKAQ